MSLMTLTDFILALNLMFAPSMPITVESATAECKVYHISAGGDEVFSEGEWGLKPVGANYMQLAEGDITIELKSPQGSDCCNDVKFSVTMTEPPLGDPIGTTHSVFLSDPYHSYYRYAQQISGFPDYAAEIEEIGDGGEIGCGEIFIFEFRLQIVTPGRTYIYDIVDRLGNPVSLILFCDEILCK